MRVWDRVGLRYPENLSRDVSRSGLSVGHPLNLILYIPFKMLSWSSNILKTNFDLMDSIPVSGTLEYSLRGCYDLAITILLQNFFVSPVSLVGRASCFNTIPKQERFA
jgi:hypothetical protein